MGETNFLSTFRYPRGYMTFRSPESDFIPTGLIIADNSIDADATLDELYKLYVSRTVNHDSWEYRKRVIATAARLFGDFKLWLTLQAGYNDYVYGLNFEFLQDTWLFIRTGRRDMSPLTWQELTLENHEPKYRIANPERALSFNWDGVDQNNVIGQWCSHEDGFGDMLCTLHVLFGMARKPLPVKINNP